MKLAILYAGQGSQHPGMGNDLYQNYPAFRKAFDTAELDFDLHSVCFEDPEGVLNQTQYTQPALVAFACGGSATVLARIIYTLVGLSALWCITLLFRQGDGSGRSSAQT